MLVLCLQSLAPTVSNELLGHPHDGVKCFLSSLARKELVKNALQKDIADVPADAEHQLQHSVEGDEVVAGLVCSDDV